MANEPITLFSRIADPAGVVRRLREVAAGVRVTGADDAWSEAVVTFADHSRVRTLTLTHDPAYYAEPNWSRQMAGMRGFFAGFADPPRRERVQLLTTTFHFCLGTIFEPDFDPDDDPRLEVLFAIAELLDGVMFTPSGLRDARGRMLCGADSEDDDPTAVWPQVRGEVSMTDPLGAAMHERSRPTDPTEEPDEVDEPPTAERAARRALALTAVTARAILEQDVRNPEATGTHADLLRWVDDVGLRDEFEPDEWAVVECPLGSLAPQQQVNATWRLEGLVVLAWALRRFDMPPHDTLVQLRPLWHGLGILDAAAARALLASPKLRTREEIGRLRNRLFAVHWRLRNFRLRPEVMDFAEFARTCWFGPLDLTGLPLDKGDLAVGGKRIDKANRDSVGTAHSAAQERHQAANWLWEGPAVYSQASVAT